MIIQWLALTTIATIGFFFIYKKTHQPAYLAMGSLAYTEILFRLFTTIKMDWFMIPEILLVIWVVFQMVNTKQYKIIMLILAEVILYMTIQLLVAYKIQGLAGFIFMLILLLWYQVNKDEVCRDPWACTDA